MLTILKFIEIVRNLNLNFYTVTWLYIYIYSARLNAGYVHCNSCRLVILFQEYSSSSKLEILDKERQCKDIARTSEKDIVGQAAAVEIV